MHLASLFAALCLLGSTIAVATPVNSVKQDITVIDAAVKRLSANIKRLDNDLKAVRPKQAEPKGQINNLLADDWEITNELKLSAQEIRRAASITAVESVTMITSVRKLSPLTQSVVDGWIDAKPMVKNAGRTRDVLNALLNASDAMAEFSDAIVSRLPKLEQALGTAYKSQMSSIVDGAIDEYRKR